LALVPTASGHAGCPDTLWRFFKDGNASGFASEFFWRFACSWIMDCLDEECSIFSNNDIAAYVTNPEVFPRLQELKDHLLLCAKCRRTVALQERLLRPSDGSATEESGQD
jgi:hypothetical protein